MPCVRLAWASFGAQAPQVRAGPPGQPGKGGLHLGLATAVLPCRQLAAGLLVAGLVVAAFVASAVFFTAVSATDSTW